MFLAGLAGMHPLRGPNIDGFGERFPPMSDAYDIELRRFVHSAWEKIIPPSSRRRLHEGVYAYVCGPRYVRPSVDDPRSANGSRKVTRQEQNAVCSD